MFSQIIAISLGASIGANLRYFGGQWVRSFSSEGFPWNTLAVNLVGSLLIGYVALSAMKNGWGETWKLFAIVGLLGGFTTFSAFSQENFAMIQDGRWPAALGYTALSVGGGLILAWVGSTLAQAS